MTDLSHLHALELRRSHEIGHISKAKTEDEKTLRKVWLSQIEKEIEREREYLGLPKEIEEQEMTIDEIFAELDAA